MKRVLVALSVPDDTEPGDFATELECYRGDADPTVWEWADFWSAYAEGSVTPAGDSTMTHHEGVRYELPE